MGVHVIVVDFLLLFLHCFVPMVGELVSSTLVAKSSVSKNGNIDTIELIFQKTPLEIQQQIWIT